MRTVAKWRSSLATGGCWLVKTMSCILLFVPIGRAQDAEVSPSPPSITIPLEYRETESDLIHLGISIDPRANPFAKEPPLSGRNLHRGTFSVGSAADGCQFIWDQGQGQLYLDLNRNGDLSDDPDGRASCSDGARSENFQQFENLRLEFPLESGSHRMRCNLNLYHFTQVGGSIALRSYWSGKAMLAGRELELGVVPLAYGQLQNNSDEMILLRPWTAVGSGFSVGDGSLDTFPCGTNLFFQGQAYRVQRQLSPEAPLQIILAPQEPALGEVRFTAQYIQRALLAHGAWTVVIDEPAGTVAVPQATYGMQMVHVGTEDAEARLTQAWTGRSGATKPLIVNTNAPAFVTAGGPLTNSVTIQRRGQSLVLNYQLIGAGGELYRPQIQHSGEAPQFAIYSGEELLEAGHFEFG
jgi:hypothetical protein